MSKVSEAIKAKRKQHRQDHYTDADRSFNGQGKKARRAGRQENFDAQGNTSASDFNFDQHGKGHIGGQEIRHLEKQGHSRDDIMAAAKANGGKIGGSAQKRFDKWSEAKERAQTNKPAVEPSTSAPTEGGDIPNSSNEQTTAKILPAGPGTPYNPNDTPKTATDKVHQEQNQNANQDNDVTSTINGDGNTVRIDQDNSVRQYGGINKSFTYNGGSNGNNYEDTPVSAGTMGGYFHDEDSPGRSASFVDRYTTMNDDYQKKYQNTGHAQDSIDAASKNKAVDVNALDQRINDRAAATRARSTVMAGDIFGDMFNFKPTDWKNTVEDKDKDKD